MLEIRPLPQVLLAEVTRSGLVESRHFGSIAIVDAAGKLLASAGDSERITYLRSSAKPLQAIPTVESGTLDRFDITERELAVMCASHMGEDIHVAAVRSILEKIGLDEGALQCGAHAPVHEPSARALARSGNTPLAVHNNCSGKHAAMLTLARSLDASVEDYLDPGHAAQVRILRAVSDLAQTEVARIHTGVDGCGAPVFALPLRNIALAYATLGQVSRLAPARAAAVRRITGAMLRHPEMVSGTGGIDTDLMKSADGGLLMKGGAEGLKCIAVLGQGVGIAIRVEDGNARAFPAILGRLLAELGLLGEAALDAFRQMQPVGIRNYQGRVVGGLAAAFQLDRPQG